MSQVLLRILSIVVVISFNLSTWAVGIYRPSCEKEELDAKQSEEILTQCIGENFLDPVETLLQKCKASVDSKIRNVSKLKKCQLESNPLKSSSRAQ